MSKNVLISGAAGFIGTHLTKALADLGHNVIILSRSAKSTKHNVINWKPASGKLDLSGVTDLDAVVHLAGESIAGRWTDEKKARIKNSRVEGTKLLAEALGGLNKKPEVLISASAIGIYGDRGDEALTEASPPGSGFLSEVGVKWEEATEPAREAGIRVCNIRIGLVLGNGGGALEKMIVPFKLGLGGKIGGGRQYWSWISIDDLVGIVIYLMNNNNLEGPVNAVSPNPLTNSEFTSALGNALNRPTIIPLPAFAARGLLGEMAQETMLSSTRVIPKKLLDAGFEFKYSDLDDALSGILTTNT